MIARFNRAELSRIAGNIKTLTGVSVTVIDEAYQEIAGSGDEYTYCDRLNSILKNYSLCANCNKELLEKCTKSKKTEYHICHAGLYDFATPIIKNDICVGYILMGRVRLKNSLQIQKYTGIDDGTLDSLYYELPVLTEEQIDVLADLMQDIIFDRAITIESDNDFEKILEFIKDTLSQKLTVEEICREFHISKTTLYNMFQKKFGVSVNDYVVDLKMKKAQYLLQNTNKTIGKIAEEVGFSNQTYFCKLFKNFTNGKTPKQVRQNAKLKE